MGNRKVRVVRVADDPGSRPAWGDREGVAVETVGPGFGRDAVVDADCAVVEDRDGVDPTAVLRRIQSLPPDFPAIVRSPGESEDPLVVTPGDSSFDPARLDGDHDRFVDLLVELGTDASLETDHSASTSKTDALHDAAMELVYCETEMAVFERAVDAAGDLLELEQTGIYVAEESNLVLVAVRGGPVIPESEVSVFGVDEGVIGQVYRTGESELVVDIASHDVAEPTASVIQSGMVVPLSDFGVFVAVSDETGAFDDRDLTLLEILAAHVTTAVDRIRSRNRIERERDRFVALFETVPDPVVITDPVGEKSRIRAANTAFGETFGVDVDAVEGDPVEDHVGLPSGEERVEIPKDGYQAAEIRRGTSDGERDFLFRGFSAQLGEDRRNVAIFTDITERNARQRELERKTERLEEFASIVSHDLRNPLSVATGLLEVLESERGPDETLAELRAALGRMDSLIDDLLTLTREGWSVDDPGPVDGRAVVERAWGNVSTPDAVLTCEWSETVRCDEGLLVEAFENLFRNSLEHGAPDGDGIHVRVRPLADAPGVAVADDGVGIPPAVRDSLFEFGASNEGDGTGLGLAIVERVVAAHGWSIRSTESESGGARFEVRFHPDDPAGSRASGDPGH